MTLRQRGPSWRVAGGSAFALDPDAPNTPFWRPEVFPGTLIVVPAPQGFDGVFNIDLATLGVLTVDRQDSIERHLVFADHQGDQYLWLTDIDARHGLAVILPLDAVLDLRIEAVIRFARRLRGHAAGPLPRGLDLTPQRRARLIQLLHALDFRLTGAGPRDIAAALLDVEAASLPAIEWKSSAIRRKANRLITDAIALMNGGYRKLLRGG